MYPKIVVKIKENVKNSLFRHCPKDIWAQDKAKYVNALLLDVIANHERYRPKESIFSAWLDAQAKGKDVTISFTFSDSSKLLIKNFAARSFRDIKNSTLYLLHLIAYLMESNQKINHHFKKITEG